MNKLSIDILGQKIDLVVKDGEIEDLKKISAYYKRTVDKISTNYPNKTSSEISILAGLMITEEFYSLINRKRTLDPEFDVKADSLINQAIKELEKSLTI